MNLSTTWQDSRHLQDLLASLQDSTRARLPATLSCEPGVLPLGRCKLLKCCPEEQELYALVGCVILNGESRNLRSSWPRNVAASGLFLGDPKLRHVYSAKNSPPWISSCPPPGRPGAALCHSVNGLSIFAVTFSQKSPVRPPDCLKPTPTHPATPSNTPQHPNNVQTKSQAPEDDHHQERIFCETGIDELVGERRTKGSLASTSSLLTHLLGPFNDKDTDPHTP